MNSDGFTDGYIAAIMDMRKHDVHVPAIMLLKAAKLLGKKSGRSAKS